MNATNWRDESQSGYCQLACLSPSEEITYSAAKVPSGGYTRYGPSVERFDAGCSRTRSTSWNGGQRRGRRNFGTRIQSLTSRASFDQHERLESEWYVSCILFWIHTIHIDNVDTDKLICIKCLVIRATPVIPDMKVAFFRCLTCSHTVQVEIDRGKIEALSRCPRDVCASVGTMSLVHNRCEFADRYPAAGDFRCGQTPHAVSLSVYDELVDVSKPGDRLVVTGIYRSVPIRSNPRQRTMKSLFKTYLDVVHIKLGSNSTLGLDKSTRPAGGDNIP